MECIHTLISDKNIYVKGNAGEAILSLISETDQLKSLSNCVEKFMTESDNENLQKFLQKVKDFAFFSRQFEAKIYNLLIKTIKTVIGTSKKWRITSSLLGVLQKIISEYKLKENQISGEIIEIVRDALSNRIFQVRQDAVNCCKQIFTQVGFQPFMNKFYAELVGNYAAKKYMTKVTAPLILKACLRGACTAACLKDI